MTSFSSQHFTLTYGRLLSILEITQPCHQGQVGYGEGIQFPLFLNPCSHPKDTGRHKSKERHFLKYWPIFPFLSISHSAVTQCWKCAFTHPNGRFAAACWHHQRTLYFVRTLYYHMSQIFTISFFLASAVVNHRNNLPLIFFLLGPSPADKLSSLCTCVQVSKLVMDVSRRRLRSYLRRQRWSSRWHVVQHWETVRFPVVAARYWNAQPD